MALQIESTLRWVPLLCFCQEVIRTACLAHVNKKISFVGKFFAEGTSRMDAGLRREADIAFPLADHPTEWVGFRPGSPIHWHPPPQSLAAAWNLIALLDRNSVKLATTRHISEEDVKKK